jgi:hypothetical protein
MIGKSIINMQTLCSETSNPLKKTPFLTNVKLPTQAYSSSDFGILTNAN